MDQTSLPLKPYFKWLLAASVVMLAAVVVYRWAKPAYQPPVQPEPNPYNDLITLSGQLAPRTGWYDEMPDSELAGVVAANEPILATARELLRKESAVSLDWQANQSWLGKVKLKQVEGMRNLSRAFAADGFYAVRENDTRRAINSGLENIHLSRTASYGGLGTDWLVGIAIHTIGLMTLRDACDAASLDDCQYVLNNLPEATEEFEKPPIITKREWHFFRPINGTFRTFVMEFAYKNNRADFEKRMDASLQMAQARVDLLRLHYVLRAFQLQEQRFPKSLHELAGRELKAVPKDPFSGRDFIYVPGKDRYILYSVGPNQVDDGSMVNDQDPQQGDLVLEPTPPAESIERED